MYRFHSRVLETMRKEFEEEISARDARILQLCAETDIFIVGERSLGGSGAEETPRVIYQQDAFRFPAKNIKEHFFVFIS